MGTIPTAENLPFIDVLNPDRTFKSPEELRRLFESVGIKNPEQDEVVLSCQRGITACIVDAAFRALGNTKTKVYDGSYEEYSLKTQK